jgi:hypothetical protein
MREILPGVIHWTARHPNIGADVSSYWLVPERVVLNPMLPAEGLRAFGAEPPATVLLTNRHHFRDSARFVDAFGAPVYAPAVGLYEFTADQGVLGYEDGDEPASGVRARAIGELSDDEYALVVARARAVAVADGLMRFGDAPIGFVPDYLMGDDPAAVKRGLAGAFARLATEEDFDTLLLAHGDPVVGGARSALREFAMAS